MPIPYNNCKMVRNRNEFVLLTMIGSKMGEWTGNHVKVVELDPHYKYHSLLSWSCIRPIRAFDWYQN